MFLIPNSRITRGLIRKSQIYQDKSSSPFISGDTYKSFCRIELTNRFEDFFKSDTRKDSVFISVNNLYQLVTWLKSNRWVLPRMETLVIHNGDVIPQVTDYYFLKSFFHKIFSVNWLGDSSVIAPLPIGLENLSYLQNGVPSDFRNSISKIRLTWEERPIEILVAFSDATNYNERRLARDSIQDISGIHQVNGMISPRIYRKLLSDSKFVLSPPGNGPDCHRTWEALYLGSIPIVKKQYWNFKALENNVVSLESWSDISTYGDLGKKPLECPVNDLMQLYLKEFTI